MAVEQVDGARGLVTWGKLKFICLLLQLLTVEGANLVQDRALCCGFR
jgi:hypothetical protein